MHSVTIKGRESSGLWPLQVRSFALCGQVRCHLNFHYSLEKVSYDHENSSVCAGSRSDWMSYHGCFCAITKCL